MTALWLHIESNKYWEGPAYRVNLPCIPRIGESIYLSPKTLMEIQENNIEFETIGNGQQLTLIDQLIVSDICYIENKDEVHLMVKSFKRQ